MASNEEIQNAELKKIDPSSIQKFGVLFRDTTAILFPFEHPRSSNLPQLSDDEQDKREAIISELYSYMNDKKSFEDAKELMLEILDEIYAFGRPIQDMSISEFDKIMGQLNRVSSLISQAFYRIPREEWAKLIPGKKKEIEDKEEMA